MKRDQIISIVEQVTGVAFKTMYTHAKYRYELPDWYRARLIVMVLLYEEGYRHEDIAKIMQVCRSNVTKNLIKVNELLMGDQKFKKQYLACIAEVTKEEDAA